MFSIGHEYLLVVSCETVEVELDLTYHPVVLMVRLEVLGMP